MKNILLAILCILLLDSVCYARVPNFSGTWKAKMKLTENTCKSSFGLSINPKFSLKQKKSSISGFVISGVKVRKMGGKATKKGFSLSLATDTVYSQSETCHESNVVSFSKLKGKKFRSVVYDYAETCTNNGEVRSECRTRYTGSATKSAKKK